MLLRPPHRPLDVPHLNYSVYNNFTRILSRMEAIPCAFQSDVLRYLPDATTASDIEPRRRLLESMQQPPFSNHRTLNSKTFRNRAAGLKTENSFFWHLSNHEVATIELSIKSFQEMNLPLSALNPFTFPLSESLRKKLRSVLDIIYGEQKFLIVSGLNPFRFSALENVIAHAGLSSHIGDKRGMSGREGGDRTVLHHITALPRKSGEVNCYVGPPNLTQDIKFHTDAGDIVSLFTLARSEQGGSFFLADANLVCDGLEALDSTIPTTLMKEWVQITSYRPIDTIVCTIMLILHSPNPDKPFEKRPIMYRSQGQVLFNCSRTRIFGTLSTPRPAALPPLSETEQYALDALNAVAASVAVKIELNAGDMILFNNMGMLHGRDAYVDNELHGHRRHLLRLVLRNEQAAWDLPVELREAWEHLFDHDPDEEVFPVKKERFTFATSH